MDSKKAIQSCMAGEKIVDIDGDLENYIYWSTEEDCFMTARGTLFTFPIGKQMYRLYKETPAIYTLWKPEFVWGKEERYINSPTKWYTSKEDFYKSHEGAVVYRWLSVEVPKKRTEWESGTNGYL